MGRKVSIRHTFMEKQLGWFDCFLPVPTGNQKNNLYHKSYWKSQRKNQKVHEIKTFIPFGRCRKKDRVSFTYGDWKEMDNAYFKLGLDYESIYAYVWKQNPDIRTNLQLNPVSIYTKFWTVSSIFSTRQNVEWLVSNWVMNGPCSFSRYWGWSW